MTQSGRTLLFFAATALAWPAIATPPLPAADFLRTVALTGTPAPEPDVVISDLRSRVFPILNNSGHTAFEANLRESDQNLDAILTEGGGDGLRVAARTQRTNDGPAFMYSLQALNDRGQTAYTEIIPLNVAAGFNVAILRNNGPSDTDEIARTDIAEEAGFAFTQFFPNGVPIWANGVSLADSGAAVFSARASDSGIGGTRYLGYWRETAAGEIAPIVLDGDPAPGTSGDFQSLGQLPSLAANRKGQIAFIARASGIAFAPLGVWSEQDTGLQLEALAGLPAPGIDDATFIYFDSMVGLSFNSQGHVAFAAQVAGNRGTIEGNFGLWRNRGNGVELAVRTSEQAAGVTPGQVYSDFDTQVLNSRGDIAFIARTRGTDGNDLFGLWSDAGGSGFEPIAYRGLPAPGVDPEVTFAAPQHFFINATFGNPLILNAHGQIAFVGELQGPGVDESNDSGIWAQDRNGVLQLIVRDGDVINVSDDPRQPDWRTISSLAVSGSSGNDDGRRSWFNDQGQLAFLATFTDGTEGLFVSNLATIPEPSTLALFAIAVASCLSCRRQSTQYYGRESIASFNLRPALAQLLQIATTRKFASCLCKVSLRFRRSFGTASPENHDTAQARQFPESTGEYFLRPQANTLGATLGICGVFAKGPPASIGSTPVAQFGIASPLILGD